MFWLVHTIDDWFAMIAGNNFAPELSIISLLIIKLQEVKQMYAAKLTRCLQIRGVTNRFASNYVVLGSSDKLKGILDAAGPKVLYFTATWCPPCKKIAPAFEKMSNEFTKTTFVKIDIDDHRDLAEEYRISAVPTFKAINGSTIVSTVSKRQLPNCLLLYT